MPDRRVHELKTLETYYEMIVQGDKMFEIRYNDRCFQKGDLLVLREVRDRLPNCYTSRNMTVEVTCVVTWQQRENYVVMGIKPVEE